MNESFQIIATLVAAQIALSIAYTPRAATSAGRHDRIIAAPLGRWPLEVLWASCGLVALGHVAHVASTEALTALRLICGAHLALLGALAVRRSFADPRAIGDPDEVAPAGAIARLACRLRAAITDPGSLPAYLSLFVTTGATTLADTEQTLLALALPTLTFAWNVLIARAGAPARARRCDRTDAPLRLQHVGGRG